MGWTSGRGREAARCGRDATVETTNTSSSGPPCHTLRPKRRHKWQVRIFATDGPKCSPAVISGTYTGTSDTRCAGTSDTGYAGTGDRSTRISPPMLSSPVVVGEVGAVVVAEPIPLMKAFAAPEGRDLPRKATCSNSERSAWWRS